MLGLQSSTLSCIEGMADHDGERTSDFLTMRGEIFRDGKHIAYEVTRSMETVISNLFSR